VTVPPHLQTVRATRRLTIQSSVATAIGFGFCRFSVGLLLEPMRAEFELSYTAAGMLASVNLASYVAGALLTPLLGRRFGYGATANIGLLLGAVSLSVLTFAPSVLPVVIALAGAGFASALAWISVAALGTACFPPARRGVLLGIVSGATGLGMIVAALVAFAVVTDGVVQWRHAWGVQAALAIVAAVAVGRIGRSHAGETRQRGATPGLGAVRRGLLRYYGAYAAFAAGYILFVTYIVSAVTGTTGDFRAGATMWLLVGIGAAPGAVLIGAGSDRMSRNGMLMITQAAAGLACLAVVLDLAGNAYGAKVAAVVIGAIMTGMGSLMPSLLADVLPAPQVPEVFASFTLVFAVIQAIAPVGGGILIDATGGFVPVFLAAGVLFGVGAIGFRSPPRRLSG
jgi:predicted MFS family arabinose efflux permease